MTIRLMKTIQTMERSALEEVLLNSHLEIMDKQFKSNKIKLKEKVALKISTKKVKYNLINIAID